MVHLKEKQYYIDLHDKFTVELCRDSEERHIKQMEEEIKKGVKIPKGYTADGVYRMTNELVMYFITGDRYLEKENTIAKWMDEDRQRDEYYDKAEPLAYCPGCNNHMELITKHLEENHGLADAKMLYIYKCYSCDQKKGVYSDGQPYIFKSDFCPECGTELRVKSKEL